jgi:Domain of unknown function (DUF4126)
MNGLFFYIGLGAGLAVACGLRPFVPLLALGALGSAEALSIHFPAGHWHFMQSTWWLIAVAGAFALSYAAQILTGLSPAIDPVTREPRGDPLAAALTGLGIGAGALAFGGVLEAHGDLAWPGVAAGAVLVVLTQRLAGPVIVGARKRLAEKTARDALTLYLDAAALVAAALVALLPPLGYVAVAALVWLLARRRSRADEKYAGLRILGR